MGDENPTWRRGLFICVWCMLTFACLHSRPPACVSYRRLNNENVSRNIQASYVQRVYKYWNSLLYYSGLFDCLRRLYAIEKAISTAVILYSAVVSVRFKSSILMCLSSQNRWLYLIRKTQICPSCISVLVLYTLVGIDLFLERNQLTGKPTKLQLCHIPISTKEANYSTADTYVCDRHASKSL